MQFGPDGKLYVGVGDNDLHPDAQSLSSHHGKVLRLAADGSIHADNPVFDATTGDHRAIWALGIRNPFSIAFDPDGSRVFVNDPSLVTWEEINAATPGANFGSPLSEGVTTEPGMTSPVYTYAHGAGNIAIVAGVFYRPATASLGPAYVGNYFFCEFAGWIRVLDPAALQAPSEFATSTFGQPVDLDVESTGSLLYLARTGGRVVRISNGQAGTTTGGTTTSGTTTSGTTTSGTTIGGTTAGGGTSDSDGSSGGGCGSGSGSGVIAAAGLALAITLWRSRRM